MLLHNPKQLCLMRRTETPMHSVNLPRSQNSHGFRMVTRVARDESGVLYRRKNG